MKEFFQGAGSAAFESVIGLESPDNDELESKLTYQSGRFAGNVVAGAASIIEILEGLTVIGGANFLTFVAEVGSGGLASPIVLPLDAAATAAGLSLVGHGVFVGRNAIQNGKDTLQKFQSSPSSGGSSSNPSTWNEFQTANKGKYSKDEMSKAWDKYKKENGIESDSGDKTYTRPSGYRTGVRDKVWDNAKSEDGLVRDPINNEIMNKDKPWDMGHLPGYEFRKHKKSAEERGITREQFLDEHNNPNHYRPELPSSNRSHKGEDLTDDYFGD
nr:HNH/ENDO VII family nuclease [Bacillus clarus]